MARLTSPDGGPSKLTAPDAAKGLRPRVAGAKLGRFDYEELKVCLNQSGQWALCFQSPVRGSKLCRACLDSMGRSTINIRLKGPDKMYIANLVIKNFRALDDIQTDLSPRINVVVGPNGVGKTTLLQALRLVKAMLAARTQHEAQQTLIALGAVSPHFPQRVYFDAIARDPAKPIEIRSTYSLTTDEIQILENARSSIIANIVQARMGQSFVNPTVMIQFLASKEGIAAYQKVETELKATFVHLQTHKIIVLGMALHPNSGRTDVVDALGAALIAHLDQMLPPKLSKFSYFPADRALPFGETNVQLGAADTVQQLESHNSQPQIKYNRLKNVIFNAMITNDQERVALFSDFETIFSGILKGRKIHSVGTNDRGFLSVMIEEIDTKRMIEIDNLSSGEKNLILTFLLISRSVAKGGIALFDEPELHLNSIVCKEILNFILNHYSEPKNIQFIICTHSPEILSGAFANEDCNLLYIKNPNHITKIGRLASSEYSEVLQKIGATVSESLLYEGTILVEGQDDVEFLRTGFGSLLKKYLIKELGGRREVEKAAQEMQDIAMQGKPIIPLLIIIDGDREKTRIKNSDSVKVLQWPRYSLENYLIDVDIIVDLLKKDFICNDNSKDEGEITKILKRLALGQLNSICARSAYEELGYKNPMARAEDIEKGDLEEIAQALFVRANSAKLSLSIENEAEWSKKFEERFNDQRGKLEPIWELKWKELCNGKRLFEDFQKQGLLKIPIYDFKRRILQGMKDNGTENWRLVESLIKENISNV